MQRSVLVVGHSHLRALGLEGYYRSDSGETRKFLYQPIATAPLTIDGLLCFAAFTPDEDILESIVTRANERIVVMLWRGNFHITEFLFQRRPVFDFVLSSQPDLPLCPEARIVPEAMVEAALRPAGADLRQWIESIRAGAPGLARLVVAATPPPKGDEAFVQARLDEEFDAQQLARVRDENSEYAVCPARVRYKLWALLMRIMEHTAQSLGVEFLDAPPAASDADGFLRREFYENDVTHANSKYGPLFVDHLQRYLGVAG